MSRKLNVKESEEYARRAIRGLLSIGDDVESEMEFRIRAYEVVLQCCGEDLTPIAPTKAVGFNQEKRDLEE